MTSDGEVWQIVGENVARAQLPNDVRSAPVEIEGMVDSQGVGSLAVRAASLDLSFLLPEDLRGLLSGSTDLDLLASFSPDAGHHASAQLVPHRIEIHGLAFFELLATLTGRPNLRNPNFASGIVTLERTQESTVILAPIRLIADNVITIEGSIVLRDGSIEATLGVGLPSAALDALPEWRGSVFRKGHGALYWREFEFQGLSVDEASATGCEQLSKLFAALRLSRKQQR